MYVHSTDCGVLGRISQLSCDRKMCGVVHRNLGKEARCAPPLHPSGSGSVRGSTPFPSQDRIAGQPLAWDTALSPAPHRPWSLRAPWNPDQERRIQLSLHGLPIYQPCVGWVRASVPHWTL